jgi:Lrp/AsnC family leucine-responsive transcriptional regulator
MPNIDHVDTQLLSLLQQNGRTSQHDLARAVGLSAPAVGERIRKLEERGIIRQYTAVLEPRRLGRDITAFISVGSSGSRHYPEFRQRAVALPEVLECHSITGQGSHLLKIRVENTAALEQLLAEVQAWPGVQWTSTSLVLSTVKETTAVSLHSGEEQEDPEDVGGPHRPADLLLVPFRHHP